MSNNKKQTTMSNSKFFGTFSTKFSNFKGSSCGRGQPGETVTRRFFKFTSSPSGAGGSSTLTSVEFDSISADVSDRRLPDRFLPKVPVVDTTPEAPPREEEHTQTVVKSSASSDYLAFLVGGSAFAALALIIWVIFLN
jgi:hypothetical protein